jgi:hypothetical protein
LANVSLPEELMFTSLKTVFHELFPVPSIESANAYRTRYSELPVYKERLAALEAATSQANLDQQKHFSEYAQQYLKAEEDRASSIISRAQALIIAQTYFGALLALATALMGHTEMIGVSPMYFLGAVLAAYTVLQLVLLTVNAIRATSGIGYSRPGVSALIKWAPKSEPLLLRNMGLEFIKSYYDANIANSWRVDQLGLAQKCIRNIVFALAFLVAGLIISVFHTSVQTKYSPPNPDFKTWNNCPPNFTVQDGLCKPYRGR